MAGLVQPDDFNADVVVRFLRDNGRRASGSHAVIAFYELAIVPTYSRGRFSAWSPASRSINGSCRHSQPRSAYRFAGSCAVSTTAGTSVRCTHGPQSVGAKDLARTIGAVSSKATLAP